MIPFQPRKLKSFICSAVITMGESDTWRFIPSPATTLVPMLIVSVPVDGGQIINNTRSGDGLTISVELVSTVTVENPLFTC